MMDCYIYNADLYCEDCGRDIRKQLTKKGLAPANVDSETTYDSDQFPTGPFDEGGGEADCPHHCASGESCLAPEVLPDGSKIGAWLENDLTEAGVRYVQETIEEGGVVAEFWYRVYAPSYGLKSRAQDKAKIPKGFRASLLRRWSAEQITDPAVLKRPDCALCIEAIRRADADTALDSKGRVAVNQCDYCPAEWPDGCDAGSRRLPCDEFLTLAIDDPPLSRLVLYSEAAKAQGRPVTQEEYEKARRLVLAQVEWTP